MFINILFKIIKFFIILLILIKIFILLFFFIVIFIYKFINPPTTPLIVYREIYNKYKIKQIKFIKLKKIPKLAQDMLIEAEDYKFYKHKGIDIDALIESYNVNKKAGYIFRGGSTITQQLARTLFLLPGKNYIRKYFEIIIALQMELILSKERILELYFNYVEWGKGIFGIEQASMTYYKKQCNYLSKDEMARLITILASPIRYNPFNFENRKILLLRYNNLITYF